MDLQSNGDWDHFREPYFVIALRGKKAW
jgi:hypothetical protein